MMNNTIEQWLLSQTPYVQRYLLAMQAHRVLWVPQSKPQWAALMTPADELFYGGSAGGGKTSMLLGLAITCHRRSIIFRREHAQFIGAGGLIEMSRDILGRVAEYNGQEATWRRIPGGRMLEFGSAQYPDDVRKYKGRAHDLLAFEEVTEFLESQYRFLSAWARTTHPEQRVRIVATGNPPSHTDGEWVLRYWAPWLDGQHPHPAQPGELRWFAVLDGRDTEVENGQPFDFNGERIQPRSRTFIPARLRDNPFLANTGYGAVLQGLPEPLRSQLLFGDFSIGLKGDAYQTIPTEWIRAAQGRWQLIPPEPQTCIGLDVARGGADKTVLAPRHGDWFAPLEKYPGEATPDGPKVAGLVINVLRDDALVNVDVIGVGASVFDQLLPLCAVQGVNFAEGCPDATDRTGKLHFANVRAHAYWSFRESLDPSYGSRVALPPDSELLADLAAPKWSIRSGRIYIESKDDLQKRLHRSPDCGDAVVLAAYTNRQWWATAMVTQVEKPAPVNEFDIG